MTHKHNVGESKRSTASRSVVLLAAAGVLVVVAVVSDPDRSSATAPKPIGPGRWLDESGQWPMVGELLSSGYLVKVYAADEGTVYTVCRPDGTVLKSGLSGDEVAESFPDLDLPAPGDDSYLLMQVDSDG